MYERLRRRMPEFAHACQFSGGDTTTSYSYGSVVSSGFWFNHRDDVSYNQLQKFWSELSLQARQELLRIDKQTLFEQSRKNMYCSRCNGLLLEGFLQIVMYGKSLHQEGTVGQASCNNLRISKSQTVEDACLAIESKDDIQDPAVHPWGGLTTTRDGTLTLLDCYLCSKSLKGLQMVFNSARARERERELLYPDACGGGGRGWISQGTMGYGRGHATREMCALHTARLSVDTLVDFWSALGEETRYSLLRMKEEDFMERLMYRFDNKRFCRDCRKNVIREFKELKELKRTRREVHCTSWFCAADTSFQYEVTPDTIQADWHQNYPDSTGMYQNYEWAVGTGEGKSDILEFENVGLNSRVQVRGLDLTGLNACYITLRAWRMDGRCNEVSVKAHALKGQRCVHCRLIVSDGYVTIARGESIRKFFEHAEEAEEEEEDDSMDKDGNDIDGECSRPQKHAKSPELAREFLLDAATVIFKEQVEKAFREGTARQNAHSMFVSLALKLLEERLLVACKDIITLQIQSKLLEEEEKEKREEEERKERRRAKEKEKKLRRKERLRSKEKEREKKCSEPNQTPAVPDDMMHKEEPTCGNDEANVTNDVCEGGEDNVSSMPVSEDCIHEEELANHNGNTSSELGCENDGNAYTSDQSKHTRRKQRFWKDYQTEQSSKWSERRRFAVVSDSGGMVSKPGPKSHSDGFENSSRSSNFNGASKPARRSNGSRYNDRPYCSHNRMSSRYDSSACSCHQHDYRPKAANKPEADMDISKPYHRGNKSEYGGRSKSNTTSIRDSPYTRKVWEPMDTQKRHAPKGSHEPEGPVEHNGSSDGTDGTNGTTPSAPKESKSSVDAEEKPPGNLDMSPSPSSNSNSDSCSSEGEGNASFSSNTQNPESSSTSDSEDASEGAKETSPRLAGDAKQQVTNKDEAVGKDSPSKTCDTEKENDIGNVVPPPLQAQSLHFPVFQPPSMGYYHGGPVPWTSAAPASGLMPLPHANHYLFASPFGYGNPHYLQYERHPLAPPILDPAQLPIYRRLPQITTFNLKEHIKAASLKAAEEQNINNLQKCFPKGQQSESGNSNKTQNNGFSLFHFGGPVAMSNGFKPDETNANLASKTSENLTEGPRGCGKKDAIEEYNLFAASNGMRFSFF